MDARHPVTVEERDRYSLVLPEQIGRKYLNVCKFSMGAIETYTNNRQSVLSR